MEQKDKLLQNTGAVLEELFNFNGQIEELCSLSEAEGEFSMDSNTMLQTLKDFIAYAKTL